MPYDSMSSPSPESIASMSIASLGVGVTKMRPYFSATGSATRPLAARSRSVEAVVVGNRDEAAVGVVAPRVIGARK